MTDKSHSVKPFYIREIGTEDVNLFNQRHSSGNAKYMYMHSHTVAAQIVSD